METLLVLIYIQLSGIIISFLLLFLRDKIERKRLLTNRYRSFIQRRHNTQPIIDYFEENPNSSLKRRFPHLHKIALATKRYKEINQLKAKGYITEKEYEGKLEEILPLIDINEDIELKSYK